MKTNWFKRTLCSILAFVMVLGYVPVPTFAAETDGLCAHHTQHTEVCGYSPAVEGHECGHAHTEECYQSVTKCVHVHGDCGYVPPVEGHDCDCQPDENGEIVHTEGCGYVEAVAEIPCDHVCSEETGCVTKALNCQHQHDAACGYAEAAAETPCGFECADCAEGASDEPAPTEYYGGSEAEADTNWGLRGASTFSLEGNSSDSLSSGFYRITTKLDRDYKLTLSSSSYSCVTTGESDAQVFYVSQLENGYFVIYDSSKTSAVTARSSEFAENTQMELREYSEILQQHWFILPADGEDGSYYIVTAENDMFLDVDNATCEENAVVKLFPRNGGYDSQNWFFEPCENYGDSDNCSCSEQYAGNYVVSNTSEVAIRDGHSITSRLLGRIPLGTEISITKASGAAGNSDAWGHVTYNGISGYIQMAYVARQMESFGSGNCGANGSNVTWNLTSDGTLTISGSGAMKDYASNSEIPWYNNRGQIQSVTIEQGVTSIGAYAFSGCSSLTSVTIPDGVTPIGESAFANCSSLTSVTIPNSVTSIGYSAFDGCSSLKDVYYGGTEEQWSKIFISAGNDPLKNATLHCNSVGSGEIIASGPCGANGDNVTYVLTDDGTLTISGTGDMSDYYYPLAPWFGNSQIKSVIIEQGVTSIGAYAFSSCGSLTNVTIPNSVTSIGSSAFYDCSSLTSVTIPDGVTSIGNETFRSCSSLSSVTIPNSISLIGDQAFQDCENLTSVTIPNRVTYIGSSAFAFCSRLTSITIPDGVTSLGYGMFTYCSNLTSMTIPASVITIGDSMFYGCSRLNNINVDSNNQYWCSVDGVLFSKDMKTLVAYPGGRAGGYECPNGVVSICDKAFAHCRGLTSVTIPNSVISIGSRAFEYCGFTRLIIPDGVTSIDEYAFYSCNSLTSVTIPDSVISIDNSAFIGCLSLKDINVDSNNKYWCSVDGVWFSKDMKTLVAYPGGRAGAYNCPDSVISIGDSAFSLCRALTSVTIPNGVTSIGDYAFNSCSSLKDVYYKGTEEQWSQIAIGADNSALTNATIHYNSNGSSSELTLVSTSPAAGATNVALDEPLVLTFSQDISEQLDWSKGKIYIRNYETNEIAETIDATFFSKSGAYVEKDKLILPMNMRTDLFNSSYSGKFYVVADAGIVRAFDSGKNEISTWGGISQKDILTFSLKRNIIGGGFTPGRDTFNFSNTDTYFGKGNNIQLLPTHHHRLASKLGIVDQLIIDTAILFNNISGKFMGNCFGMSALMGLLYTNKLSLDGMQKDARCVFDLNKPKSDENIRSYLSYYQLLQYIVVPTDENIGSEQEESRNMVRTLLNGKSPVMLSIKIIGDDGKECDHEVLAFAIDADIDSDHYVVYFADPNQMIVPDTIDGQLIEPLKMRPANSALFISKDDYSYSGAIVSGSGKHMNKSSIKSVYYSITDLSVFDTLSIESSDTYLGQKLDSFLATACRDFSLIDVGSGKEIVVQDGHIVHGEGLHGPYTTVWGNDTGNLAFYFFDSENEWEFVPLESKTQLTLIGFAQAEKAMRAESNAKSIRFSPSGRVSFSEASSQSKLCITQNKVDSDVFAFSLTTDAGDISLTPQEDGSFKVESEEPIGNITVESINPNHDAGSVTKNISGTSAIAAPVQDDQYEIIESNNYTIEVGANGKWQKGSKQALAFESNGPVDKFQKLVLNGADLADVNYTVSEKNGNTVVSLKAEYLQTLETGPYSLYCSFTDGKTSDISFTVDELFNRLDLSLYNDFNNQAEIFIDGVPYPIESSSGRCVNIPRDAAIATSYQIHNSNSDDAHLRYPEGMMVYRIVHSNDGIAKLEKIDVFTDLLQYSGSSIRITGNKGIRMITSVNQDTRNKLTGNGLAGFKLLEYGTLLAQTSKLGDNPLVLGGGDYVKSNYAYKKGVADPVFKYTNGLIQYTNVLVGFTDEQCKEDIAMRPYMKLLDENGEEFVIYGGIVYRSIGYIAYQNRNAFQPRSAAYEYVWSIIHNVYGTKYDSEYRK